MLSDGRNAERAECRQILGGMPKTGGGGEQKRKRVRGKKTKCV